MPTALANSEESRALSIDKFQFTLTWLGQAGFELKFGRRTLLIDPYLSDSLAKKYQGKLFPHLRMVASPIQPENISECDYLLCTHSHTDHMDPETILPIVKKLNPKIIYPRFEKEIAHTRGIPTDKNVGCNFGEVLKTDFSAEIYPIPAAHEELVRNEAGDFKALGYVIKWKNFSIYHSGDCIPFEGQAELLRNLGVNIALLPVNGRDNFRSQNGVPGNFNYSEAVTLCNQAGIELLIPHHWGMFEFNTASQSDLEILKNTQSPKVIVPAISEPMTFSYNESGIECE